MFTKKYTKLVVFFVLVLLLILYMGPLLGYLPRALGITRDFVMDGKYVRQDNGRTNVVILGLGGAKNEPSGLTDTILFASLDRNTNQAVMVSLPRDIWIPEMQAKINTAYHYGNEQDGLGIEWARRWVSQILGQPVHYMVVISFDGFVRLIDLLGGADVRIDKAFTDNQYPLTGREADTCGGDPKTLCRYETISFNTGVQHLDGTTALKYARSRHAEGEEGSDFARARRQQEIILAVKDKVLSTDFLLNPKRVSQVLQIIEDSIETDIPESHMGGFAKLALNARDSGVKSVVLEDGFLVNPPLSPKYGNQYVLIPRADTWQPAQSWVDCLLTKGDCQIEDFTREIRD